MYQSGGTVTQEQSHLCKHGALIQKTGCLIPIIYENTGKRIEFNHMAKKKMPWHLSIFFLKNRQSVSVPEVYCE